MRDCNTEVLMQLELW